MALEDTRRSIWHAFTALAKGENGEVAKSSLKVLTNNVGRALGKDKGEEILEDSSANLTFKDYYEIIEPRLLCPQDGSPESFLIPSQMAEIDKICWMLCEGYYLKNSVFGQIPQSVDLSNELFKLWKVFNFLAKVDPESKLDDKVCVAALPLRVDVEEAYRFGSLIRQAVGYDPSECPNIDPDAESTSEKFVCDFVRFVGIVATAVQDLPPYVFRQGLTCVSDEILHDVIKKGYMEKFGNHVTNWKRRWFCLTATGLKYFTTDHERDLKGTIEVSKDFRPENQKPGQHKQFRLKLVTANRSFELASMDLRSKNEWMTALQKAADHFERGGSFQKFELEEREGQRMLRREKIADEEFGKSLMKEALQDRERRLEEEAKGRLQDKSLLKKREEELEAERQARLEVEARLADEAAALEAERIRLKELEEIRKMLEELLEQERQAKRDEEIVRNLQAKLLEEEMEKHAELERLQAEQNRLLCQEREEKAGLQREREEQDLLLNKTQQQLDKLQADRHMAEQKIREAEEKMKLAEIERLKMEERLRLREMSTAVGLRRPMPTPNPDPFITHRGKGAFVEADFTKKVCLDEMSPSRDANGQHGDRTQFDFGNKGLDNTPINDQTPASNVTHTPSDSATHPCTGSTTEPTSDSAIRPPTKSGTRRPTNNTTHPQTDCTTEPLADKDQKGQREDRMSDHKERQEEFVKVKISPNIDDNGKHVSFCE